MRDPLQPVRRYLKTHNLRELARETGVPATTIHSWLTRGTPASLTQALRVVEYVNGFQVREPRVRQRV